jgi:hypothetical protein
MGWEDLTVSQVINAYNGFYEKELERAKCEKIITWETTRWQTWVLWNLQVTKKYKISDPKKLIKFDWDNKPESIDPKVFEEINNRFPDKFRNGNK